ncbi:DUF3817 domain-containing protein [Rhizobium sp. BT-175]|uniref:DUF3817 domain-containing protein n=1 Tax=Rhizobium sp. BT-175 TaxID=2986929 RepID=UPI002236979A|nr:DUF3817 domain-containing protein [Rhizobium sp. BT-175]MCV9947585.1 DUF3817 domain-containing protein [Rhizobium sp. BT-175]
MLEPSQIRRLRIASLLEGTTLLALVLIAVPAKHLFGIPLATKIMGPIHGLAFVGFLWTFMATVTAGGWSRNEIIRLLIGSCTPFGAFVNSELLKRKEAVAAEPTIRG